MMTYGLAKLVIGSRAVAPITEREYCGLAIAKDGLLSALSLEEKFDLVAENYLELETELLSSTTRHMLLGSGNYQWFQLERNLINRRLLNLLSVCRGYLDFVKPYGLGLLSNDSQEAAKFAAAFGMHYDSTFGYRVMEALRNHVQHRGFPIHALEYNSTLNEKEPRNRFRFGVAVYTKTSYLREDGDFKAGVLAELEALGGRVDLKPLFRDYVASLAAIHEQVREQHKTKVTDWEAKFFAEVQRYKSAFPNELSLAGLAAVKIDGNNRSGEINLFPGFIEHRKYLESKNRGFGNFANRYVTGQVKGTNA